MEVEVTEEANMSTSPTNGRCKISNPKVPKDPIIRYPGLG